MSEKKSTSGQGQKSGVAKGLDVDWMKAKRAAWCPTVWLDKVEKAEGTEKALEHAERFRERVKEFCNDSDKKLTYAKVALERTKEERLHLHAYLWYKNGAPLGSTVKNFLAKSAGIPKEEPHIEGRIKSHEEAKSYPGREEKDGSVLWVSEYGNDTGAGQGNRTKDISERAKTADLVLSDIQAGLTKKQIWQKYGAYMTRNFRGIYEGASVLTGDLWLSEEKLHLLRKMGVMGAL